MNRCRIVCLLALAVLFVYFLRPSIAWPQETRARGAAAAPASSARVTFSDTIAPIVYTNCVTCHRPGEAAPFSLISYEDVAKRGALIAKVTAARYMPPWHAAHGYGEFADERRLTDAQIAAIGEWVKQGMPRFSAEFPKIKVQVENATGSLSTVLLASAAGGTIQDVFNNENDVFQTLARQGDMVYRARGTRLPR